MNCTRLLILKLMWLFFRKPSVVLIDHDGEMNPCLARGPKNFRFARRMCFGIANIRLLPDGGTSGKCYVTKWEPLFGLAVTSTDGKSP